MWNFDSQTPIYMQLSAQIRLRIIRGEYPAGAKLPSVREFAVETRTNPNTILKALSELETQGLIETQRTNGKFVTSDQKVIAGEKLRMIDGLLEQFVEQMKQYNLDRKAIIALLNKKDGK